MATTKEQARVAIVTKVEALRATWAGTLAIEYDNRENINYSTQVDPFLRVNIMTIGGYQIDLARSPQQRVLGSIVLTAFARCGSGTKAMNDLLQHFYPDMQMTDSMSPVRTHAAQLVTAPEKNGWAGESAVIPFWYDN